MKITLPLLTVFASSLVAAPGPEVKRPVPPTPPPVTTVPAPQIAAAQPAYVYEQQTFTAGVQSLVSPQQAQQIIDQFKAAYPKLGNPRLLIYVNRELVDEKSGVKLADRREHIERTTTKVDSTIQGGAANPQNPSVVVNAGGNVSVSGGGNFGSGPGKATTTTEKATGDYNYRAGAKSEPTLADRQTVRDVERLFGRPLRMGGATLVDQRLATALMTDKSIGHFSQPAESEQARKDREAVARNADAVIEILISSKQVTVPEVSGDKIYSVPDIQATAISVRDSKILGQAAASELLKNNQVRYDVREVTEAVALALMEDMLLGAK